MNHFFSFFNIFRKWITVYSFPHFTMIYIFFSFSCKLDDDDDNEADLLALLDIDQLENEN